MKDRDPLKLYPFDHLLRVLTDLFPLWLRPNHLTVLRMTLTPLVLWLLAEESYRVGVPLFLFAAFTDALDGTLARTRRQITAWGTFYDPVADKLLISSVVLLIVMQHINILFGLLIIFVELTIVMGGLIRKRQGIAVTANVWGKIKMFLQVVGVMSLLVAVWLGVDLFIPVSVGTLSLAIVFGIISLFTYGL
ncbi:CDP-alcohol phosphatidyltransferase family protein [Candidatus Uhrbacteria bacterium]|nr:CDP-alcohol phosphatidyltransferase family protein [Candidatus Uhrbacteria bacterium]